MNLRIAAKRFGLTLAKKRYLYIYSHAFIALLHNGIEKAVKTVLLSGVDFIWRETPWLYRSGAKYYMRIQTVRFV